MRAQHAVFLAAATLLASYDGVWAATSSTLSTSRAIFVGQNDITPKRFLRSTEYDEDRGVNWKAIPGLEKFTNLFKSKVSLGTLDKWVKKKLPPQDVFKRFKLDKTGTQLFDNPDVNVWAAYTRAVVNKDPETVMLSTLATRYSDDVLSTMLIAGKKSNVKGTVETATALQTEKMRSWMTAGYTPDDMFKAFKLNKAGDDLLESQLLTAWTDYMKFYNKAKKSKLSLIETLTKHYTERGVLEMYEAAKKVPSRAATGKRLEAEQLQNWLMQQRSPDDLFTLMSLDKTGDALLSSPRFQTWTKYVNNYNKEYPAEATTMLTRLTNMLDDAKLTSILVAARKVPGTEAAAANLQAEQFKNWLAKDPISEAPANVFKFFQLDKAGDDLLANPQFSLWGKYVENYNMQVKNDENLVSLIDIVGANYKDDVLANIILAGKKVPGTQALARRMEDDLFKGWFTNLKTPDVVFYLLKLNTADDKVFDSPLWGVYTAYLDHFNKSLPHKHATMISALTRAYDKQALTAIIEAAKKVPGTEKLATKLEMQHWLARKDAPEEIFDLLKLGNSVDDFLANPLINRWATYLEMFNEKYPKERVSMIDTFRAFFGDEALAPALMKAKGVAGTERVATTLEASLINKWILSKKKPGDVAKILSPTTAADDPSSKLLRTYTNKFKDTYG